MISGLKNDKFTSHFSLTSRFYLKASYIFAQNIINKTPERAAIQFLYGHYLFNDEVDNFNEIIKYLKKNFKIIPYSEAVERVKKGNIDQKYICFSFDDGILNCMRIAEQFHNAGISAMFFINPHIAENHKNEDFIKQHCKEKLEMKEVDFMGWNEIEQLRKWNHEIGNHTLSHKDLGKISSLELEEEINASKIQLERNAGKITHFAWPYGRRENITPEAFNLIINSGHESVASAIRGQHFEAIDLSKNFILRDQVVFKEPLWFLPYFISRNQQKKVSTRL